MTRLVQRYGPQGAFWSERPDVPRRPLRDWQIWNEPHFDFYWYTPEGSWAPEYVELLKAARRAIKSADPSARVVLAGFADASWKVLTAAYKAGVRGAYDVATINLFTGNPGFVMTAARLMRHVLKREREPRKPIWVTETTFPAARGLVPPPEKEWQRRWYTTRSGMAKRLTELYRLGRGEREAPRAAADLLVHVGVELPRARTISSTTPAWCASGEDGASTSQPALRAYRRASRKLVGQRLAQAPGRALRIRRVPDRAHHDHPASARLDHLADVRLVDAADREPRPLAAMGGGVAHVARVRPLAGPGFVGVSHTGPTLS